LTVLADIAAILKGRSRFAGGVHPHDHKALAADCSIEPLPTPGEVLVPLHQHTGSPCQPAVKAKQAVAVGDVIGTPTGAISSPVHASVTGQTGVATITLLATGLRVQAIPITAAEPGGACADPADVYGGDWTLENPAAFEPDQIIDKILAAGIVGLGGAAFPTHFKLRPNPKKPVDTLLLNGSECEPYLTSDYRLMIEYPEPIVAGMRLAMQACGAARGVIAIEDNKPAAIDSLRDAVAGYDNIEVKVCQTKYPMGGERQLIYATLGRKVPSAPVGLPFDVGVAVVNVGTSAAIAAAVLRDRPLTHRIVTVTGGGVAEPKNLLAPIGARFADLVAFCGGLRTDADRVIAGGPMMGFAVATLEIPVTKGTSGITVLSDAEVAAAAETTCVRCGRCVDACTLRLVPTRLGHAAKNREYDTAERYNINACCECGVCAYVCPARIPLVQYIRAGKAALRKRAKR